MRLEMENAQAGDAKAKFWPLASTRTRSSQMTILSLPPHNSQRLAALPLAGLQLRLLV